MKIKSQYWITLVGMAAVLTPLLVHMFGIAQRNAQYRRILKSYSDALKPGVKRREVETYFIMSRYVSFSNGNIVARGAYDEIVEIAREKEGWVCQEQVIYVVFKFAASEPQRKGAANPEDRLTGTSLDRSFCLDLP